MNAADTNPESKVFLILGAGITKNMGVCALASGSITSIWNSFPNATINLFDYYPFKATYDVIYPDGSARVPLVNIRFSKKIWVQNHIIRLIFTALFLRLIPSRKLKARILRGNPFLRCVYDADVIGSIAGGDSFSDIYGLRRLIYVSLPQLLVLTASKPLVLLPQTIGPFRTVLGKCIARHILKKAARIYSRENEGIKTTEELLGKRAANARFAYDMGFALEPSIREDRVPEWLPPVRSNTPLIGLNISGLLYIGGYRGNNMFGLKSNYSELIQSLIASLVESHDAHIMLVPHVFGNAGKGESDLTACNAVLRDAGHGIRSRLHVIDDRYDQHELKALIGYCDFFIGSRMHACIAALSQCVPAVGLAYSPKFYGVFESIEMQELMLDLREQDKDSILKNIQSLYLRRAAFHERLTFKIPEVRNAVLSLFADF